MVTKIAVTGHRTARLQNKQEEVREWIKEQLINLKACYKDIELLDGMAKGVDQIAALVAINLGIPVKCYFPYKHKLSELESYIAAVAEEIDWGYDEYPGKHAYIERDRRMVDDCDVLLVVWDGKEEGGTYYTYEYAKQEKKNVLRYRWR